MTYKPRKFNRAMLARAWEMVQAAPYHVTLRWLFYGLLQEGWYSTKDDYKDKFQYALRRARRDFYEGWRPNTLVDDTRNPVIRGSGFDTVQEWIVNIPKYFPCQLDRWNDRDRFVELWFEARGMLRQFEYYTDHITLRPMGGQPSQDYKWKCAKAIEQAIERYGKPTTVLYFGDLDTGGEVIGDVVERDTRDWCKYDFEFIRCGLTMDQVVKYDVPENFQKPGDYQWEALAGDLEFAAREIISEATEPFVRQGELSELDDTEAQATERLRGELRELAERWQA